ncbi:MAG: OmpH family outer membrane protein [Halanaerobiaceae bacterium]
MFKRNYILIIGIMVALILVGYAFMNYSVTDILAQNESSGRIAYVDVEEVYNIHPQKKVAEEKLGDMAQDMETTLKEEAGELSESEQQKQVEEYQQELSDREQELIKNILDEINQVIQTVAEEKEVKIVMEKQNVIYGGYNLTSDVKEYIRENEDEVKTELE